VRRELQLQRLPARERARLGVIMATGHVGWIVTGCLVGGLVVALALVLGPVAGAREHVITGTVLLTCAASWGLLTVLSKRWTAQPQRWAATLAAFMAAAGTALLLFVPSEVVIDGAGWVWPPLLLAVLARTARRVHRDLHSRTRTWVVYPMLAVYALIAVGGSYQTIRESLDRRMHVAPGRLVDVGGHRLHLSCTGFGLPTVVLESGLGETAAYWGWIAPVVARDTRVCVYDRAGRGWSDPAPAVQDGVAVATDLQTLLDRTRIPGPFVLVGHSSGAAYVRIFAGRYPRAVAGMVLLDGQPPEAFESLPSYPSFYSGFRRISALFPSLARLGVGRLVPADRALPSHARDVQRLHHASPRLYRSLRDEFAELPTTLAEARSTQDLGDRPLVVVTAERDALTGWLPLQDRMAALSSNSSHRVVPYTHDALVTDRTAAQTSVQAIRDVVYAVRFATPLEKS
jgi:pimeloyl-ACP methyl ester carboxylesterase